MVSVSHACQNQCPKDRKLLLARSLVVIDYLRNLFEIMALKSGESRRVTLVYKL